MNLTKENMLTPSKPILPSSGSFLQQHGLKLAALLLWAIALTVYYLYLRQNNLTVAGSLDGLNTFLTVSLFGPLLYILIYAIRPLLFFPSTLLTLLGGFLFGPWGILYTVFGSNASALLAYAVGRYFGQGILDNDEASSIVQKYTRRLRQNSFETVLVTRLIFLPYDLINYAAGFLKINWRAFLAATAIGSFPGTISVVLLGSSFGTMDELMKGEVQLNPITLAISIVLILASLGLSRALKNRETRRESAR